MTIEDKAKLYDEALKKAKDVIEQNPLMEYLKKGIECILPELKESEDEKSKKWILEYLHDGLRKSDEQFKGQFKCAIAWLEKQGEQKQDPCEHCDDKRLNCHNFPCIKKKAFKQGKSALEAINDINDKGYCFILKKQDKSALSYHEEKVDNANKVEPKFKVGDWVILTAGELSSLLQIVKVDTNKKLYWFNDSSYLPIVDEECLHFWTLSDVKNGDILYSPSLHLIWIYKNNKEVHAGINMNYASSLSIETSLVIPNDACPATKEQRDTLMKAMADAGYTFDFEKKKLKKIEVEPAWSYEDEANLNNIIWLCNNCIKGSETTWIPSQATKIKHLIETIKEKGLVQQNPAWSEEDKKTLERVIRCIENHDYMNVDDIHWLKSLKQRYTWKPSDAQIQAVRLARSFVTDDFGENPTLSDTLVELEEQLKKLK